MSTVRDLIKGSMRLLNVIATGETPTADELNDALSTLNDMLDSWSNESLLVYSQTRETFAFTPSKQTYTIGTTGDFSTTRPAQVLRIGIEVPGSPVLERPVRLLNLDEWARLSVKSISTSIPTMCYVENTYPLTTLNFWPVPNVVENAVIYSEKPFGSFTSINQTLSLPPGYLKALRYNLAVELAPEYEREPQALVLQGAIDGREVIKRRNIKPVYLTTDFPSQRSVFNWLIGE